MRHLYALLLIFFFVGFSIAQNNSEVPPGQSWVHMMQDPSANYNEIIEKANAWYETHPKGKGSGFKAYKRWAWSERFNVMPDGKRAPHGHKTKEFYRTHNSRSLAGNWQEMGPVLYPVNNASQPTGLGRLNAVAVNPANSEILYAGAAAGGFWISTDNGQNWQTTTDNIPNLGISAIAVNPIDPQIIYIGSGDRDGSDAPGQGVYKSIDGGQNFNEANNGMGNLKVNAMIVHPTNPNIVLAATSQGVYKTTDAANNWARVSPNILNYIDICWKTDDPSVVYTTETGRFYKSTNTGDNWLMVIDDLPTFGTGRGSIGVSEDAPDIVYFVISDQSGVYKGTWRSTNGGTNFEFRSDTPTGMLYYTCDGSGTGGQGWYDQALAVNPDNADELVIGGVNLWHSIDGGMNWEIIACWEYRPPLGLHADHHALKWHTDGRLFSANDGGLHYTDNNGQSFTEISSGLAIGQGYRIGGSAQDPNLLITGFQDNGTAIFRNYEWTTVIPSDGMECAIDPNNDSIMYGTYMYGMMYRSMDGGENFEIIAGYNQNGITEGGAWVTPYFLDDNNSNKALAGYVDVWRCNDMAAATPQWEKISDFGHPEHIKVEVLVQSYAKPEMAYAATADWKVYRCDDIFAADPVWTPLGNPFGYLCYSIETHPTNPDIAWATSYGKVFKTTDRGQNWTQTASSPELPYAAYSSIVCDKTKTNNSLYLATDAGIFYTDDNLGSWIAFDAGLSANAMVRELEFFYDANPCKSRLRAITYGRGLWQSDLYAAGDLNFMALETAQPIPQYVAQADELAPVYRVGVINSSCGDANTISQMKFTIAGTNATDIENAQLWFTGANGNFFTNHSCGNANVQSDSLLVFDFSKELSADTNYFWLSYNISADAALKNYIDAELISVVIEGATHDYSGGATSGNSMICASIEINSGNINRYTPGLADARQLKTKSRFSSLYDAAELNNSGMEGGSSIVQLAWYKANDRLLQTNGYMAVYGRNTSDSTLSGGTAWTEISGNAQKIYESNSQKMGNKTGWQKFTLDQPFEYTGSNLQISTDWDNSFDPTQVGFQWLCTEGTQINMSIGANSSESPATLPEIDGGGSLRPNIKIYYIPVECPAPADLAADSIGTNAVKVSWTDNAGSSSFEIEYGLSGFIPGSGVLLQNQSNPAIISGLDAATEYDFYVRTECADTVSGIAGPLKITTNCEIISSFPWTEGFENFETDFPCWSVMKNTEAQGGINGNGLAAANPVNGTCWYVNTYASYVHQGLKSASISNYTTGYSWLISPYIQLPATETSLLRYWMYFYAGGTYDTKLYIMVEYNGSWQQIALHDNGYNPYSSEVENSLADYAGKEIRIAFVYPQVTSAYPLSIDDVAIVTDPASITSWTGNADSDWQNAANWSNGVPNAGKHARIDTETHQPVINQQANDPAECASIEIEAGSTLELAAGAALSILGNLEITGNMMVRNNASLIVDGEIQGSMNIYRNLQTADSYHFLASPVNNILTGDIFDPSLYQNIWLRQYDEPSGSWNNLNTASPLQSGKGYSYYMDVAAAEAVFIGQPFNNTVSNIALSNQGTIATGPPLHGENYNGWNLLGNPYPAALDANSGDWQRQNVNNEIQVWDAASGQYKFWANGVGTLSNGIIPPQQAFFVKATDENARISIPREARVHNGQGFYKSSGQLFELHLSSDDCPYDDHFFLRLATGCSEAFDAEWDAHKLAGELNAPMLYALSAEGWRLSVQTLSEDKLQKEYPLYFHAGLNGQYVLSLANAAKTAEAVWLIDHQSGQQHKLSNSPYPFDAQENDDEKRFSLLFESNSMDKLQDQNWNAYSVGGKLHIALPQNAEGKLRLYNASGLLVWQHKITENNLFVNTKHLSQGVYLLLWQYTEGQQSIKISL